MSKQQQSDLYRILDNLGIQFEQIEHLPMFTVADTQTIEHLMLGPGLKNLFLKDNNMRFWLISALHTAKVQLKMVSKVIKAPELRFAQQELLIEQLGIQPGSVTPLAIMLDNTHTIPVILDVAIWNHRLVGMHPLQNDATLFMNPDDLLRFLNHYGQPVIVFDFEKNEIVTG